MAGLSRLFGQRKANQPNAARLEKVTTPVDDVPRPVRAMVYREASVTYESGYVRKGIVLDYSDQGVRVRFPTNETLPKFLTLHARSVGVEGVAQVIWQKGSEAGLKLLP